MCFLNDDPSSMTRGRNIARRLLSKKWYNPNGYDLEGGRVQGDEEKELVEGKDVMEVKDKKEKLSLMKRWAYFKHVTLAWYVVNEDKDSQSSMNLQSKCRMRVDNE